MSVRRRIEALRRLADSTTFPAEAASARAMADRLESQLEPEDEVPENWGRFPSFEEAMGANWRNRVMEQHAIEEAELTLGAVRWTPHLWLIPGVGPAIDKDELLRRYSQGIAA